MGSEADNDLDFPTPVFRDAFQSFINKDNESDLKKHLYFVTPSSDECWENVKTVSVGRRSVATLNIADVHSTVKQETGPEVILYPGEEEDAFSEWASVTFLRPDYTERKDDICGIFWAVHTGDLTTLRLLLSKGSYLDRRLINGNSVLMEAVASGSSNSSRCVELLLEAGARITIPNAAGHTVLTAAASLGRLDVLKLLRRYRQPLPVNYRTKRGSSALMLAAVKGHFEVVRFLMNDPNISLLIEDTRFMTAVCWSQVYSPPITAFLCAKLVEYNVMNNFVMRRIEILRMLSAQARRAQATGAEDGLSRMNSEWFFTLYNLSVILLLMAPSRRLLVSKGALNIISKAEFWNVLDKEKEYVEVPVLQMLPWLLALIFSMSWQESATLSAFIRSGSAKRMVENLNKVLPRSRRPARSHLVTQAMFTPLMAKKEGRDWIQKVAFTYSNILDHFIDAPNYVGRHDDDVVNTFTDLIETNLRQYNFRPSVRLMSGEVLQEYFPAVSNIPLAQQVRDALGHFEELKQQALLDQEGRRMQELLVTEEQECRKREERALRLKIRRLRKKERNKIQKLQNELDEYGDNEQVIASGEGQKHSQKEAGPTIPKAKGNSGCELHRLDDPDRPLVLRDAEVMYTCQEKTTKRQAKNMSKSQMDDMVTDMLDATRGDWVDVGKGMKQPGKRKEKYVAVPPETIMVKLNNTRQETLPGNVITNRTATMAEVVKGKVPVPPSGTRENKATVPDNSRSVPLVRVPAKVQKHDNVTAKVACEKVNNMKNAPRDRVAAPAPAPPPKKCAWNITEDVPKVSFLTRQKEQLQMKEKIQEKQQCQQKRIDTKPQVQKQKDDHSKLVVGGQQKVEHLQQEQQTQKQQTQHGENIQQQQGKQMQPQQEKQVQQKPKQQGKQMLPQQGKQLPQKLEQPGKQMQPQQGKQLPQKLEQPGKQMQPQQEKQLQQKPEQQGKQMQPQQGKQLPQKQEQPGKQVPPQQGQQLQQKPEQEGKQVQPQQGKQVQQKQEQQGKQIQQQQGQNMQQEQQQKEKQKQLQGQLTQQQQREPKQQLKQQPVQQQPVQQVQKVQEKQVRERHQGQQQQQIQQAQEGQLQKQHQQMLQTKGQKQNPGQGMLQQQQGMQQQQRQQQQKQQVHMPQHLLAQQAQDQVHQLQHNVSQQHHMPQQQEQQGLQGHDDSVLVCRNAPAGALYVKRIENQLLQQPPPQPQPQPQPQEQVPAQSVQLVQPVEVVEGSATQPPSGPTTESVGTAGSPPSPPPHVAPYPSTPSFNPQPLPDEQPVHLAHIYREHRPVNNVGMLEHGAAGDQGLQMPAVRRVRELAPQTLAWLPRSVRWRDRFERLVRLPPQARQKVGSIHFSFSDPFLQISEGSNGTVVSIGLRDDGMEVAVKRMLKSNFRFIRNELQNLRIPEVEHENIVKYRDYAEDEHFVYLALELCECTLERYVSDLNKAGLLKGRSLRLAWQILRGLNVLHEAKILHMDLKPRNVLIDVRGNVRLADFGLSRRLDDGQSTVYQGGLHGTRCWRPREMLMQQYSEKQPPYKAVSDIQVAGMIIYYVISGGQHPYGDDACSIEQAIRDGVPRLSGVRDEIFVHFMSWMMHHDMSKRMSAKDCLTHPFFWPDSRKFAFLYKISHEPEFLPHASPSAVRTLIDDLVRRHVPDWKLYIDPYITSHQTALQLYSNDVAELLRFMADAEDNFNRMDVNQRTQIGDLGTYFLHKFSGVFMIVYEMVRASPLRYRRSLSDFFDMPSYVGQ